MLEVNKSQKVMPDVASENLGLDLATNLDWVGMKEIEVPVLIIGENGQVYHTPARVDAGVSLDNSKARGIHMSRIYKDVQDLLSSQALSGKVLNQLLQSFLKNHQSLSSLAKISVHFQLLLKRHALKSENTAWRTYPVVLSAEKKQNDPAKFFAEVQILYSSTCPASAALARQLIQENFHTQFSANDSLSFSEVHQWLGVSSGILATPHAQRSRAQVKVQIREQEDLKHLVQLIDLLEDTLQTAVQGLVKREDEQEFALRNGQNLMFCEDAGRRIKSALELRPDILDYCAEIRHLESLHPHDAVSVISKGLGL